MTGSTRIVMNKRSEQFAKPKIVCSFLPTDAPIKATQEVNFEEVLKPLLKKGKEDDAKELIAGLTSARQMLLWALDRDRTTVSADELVKRLAEYGRLLRGFVSPPEGESNEKRATTLRFVISWVWRDLLDVKGRDWKASDVALEEASTLMAAAQNILSRAARELVSDSNAIHLHTNLRRVAGMLARARSLVDEADKAAALAEAHAEEDEAHEEGTTEEGAEGAEDAEGAEGAEGDATQDEKHEEKQDEKQEEKKAEKKDAKQAEKKKKKRSWWGSKSKKSEEKKKKDTMDSEHTASTDLRLALPEAWAQLALAEAQHATLRKACNQGHIEWTLIASLCLDEHERYNVNVSGHVEALTKAAESASNVKEWAGKRICAAFLRSHVEMKALYFEALVRYCQGAPSLERAIADTDEDACSHAVAHLAAAAQKHKEAQQACDRFVSTAKPITYVDSPVVPLADSFAVIRTALDRANQLNNSIFHKPPQAQLDAFPEKKSLIAAIPYEDPGVSHLWTVKAWDAFDPDLLPDPQYGVASDARECCSIS